MNPRHETLPGNPIAQGEQMTPKGTDAMTQPTADANAVLMGGGGPPAWKFEDPGTRRVGWVASGPIARQEREYDPNNPGGGKLKVFPSGDPIMGIVVEVNTNERDPNNPDDDGRRTFYVEGRYIKEAVREAVKKAGANGLEVGGQLDVTFTHREDPADKRSRKYWTVVYTPAASVALMDHDGQPTQPPQAPVSQPQTPPMGQQVPGVPNAPQAPAQPPQQAPQPAPPTPEAQAAAQQAAGGGMSPQAMADFAKWQAQQQQGQNPA